MKKIVAVLLLAVVCIVSLTACKKDRETIDEPGTDEPVVEGPVEEPGYKFGYSAISMENPFFISLEGYLRKAVEAEGHTLITKDAQTDAGMQLEQISELIEEGIDAIFLTPVDWIEIGPALTQLKEAGVKIINLDTKVQSFELVDAYIGSDNKQAGKLCGEDLVARLPEGGEIIIVECPNRNSINDRIQAFEKEATAKKGFSVVARIDSQGQLETTLEGVKLALKEHPNVVAIMCGNDPSAIGALVASNHMLANDVIIYGIDGSPEVKKEIVKGNSKIVATVAQSTQQMAEQSVQVACKILDGQSYEKNILLETYLIHAGNISEYDVDNWQ